METYQINDLERLSGIKAHTIRIWEKRYGLVTPLRTDSNRRLYDDAQLKKILNVATLLASGHKISHIAAMTDEQIRNHIKVDAAVAENDYMLLSYINDLLSCLITFDEAGFEKIFSAAVIRIGLKDTMLKVVYPFLVKAGILWSVDGVTPLQEHFASSIIRRKLMSAIDGVLPFASPDAPKFILFLPPGEWHDIGLLFADYILRTGGFRTIYLGQDVPLADIVDTIRITQPQYLFTFFTTPRPANEMAGLIDFYVAHGNLPLLCSGTGALLEEIPTQKGVTKLTSVDNLFIFLQNIRNKNHSV